MSTRCCNHCTLEAMKLHAANVGHTITLRPRAIQGFPDGVDLYIHPPDYTPPDPSTANLADWWAGWFAAAPTACYCHE